MPPVIPHPVGGHSVVGSVVGVVVNPWWPRMSARPPKRTLKPSNRSRVDPPEESPMNSYHVSGAIAEQRRHQFETNARRHRQIREIRNATPLAGVAEGPSRTSRVLARLRAVVRPDRRPERAMVLLAHPSRTDC
jgi:hypothetical protein